VTRAEYLPLLLACPLSEYEGTADKTPVKVLPYRALDTFLEDRSSFAKKYGALDPALADRLWRILRFTDAVRIGRKTMLIEAAEAYLDAAEVERASKEPAAYLQDRVNRIAAKAELVLWEERRSGELSVGILCPDIAIATAVLVMFRVGSAQPGEKGQCLICKKLFIRKSGHRRRTCSDGCRMTLSRRGRQRKTQPRR
jgi:hypothetical protein